MKKLFTLGLFTCILLSTYSQVNLNDGLVGYYPFNGNANDESGNGNNGTTQGGVTLTTDRFEIDNSAYNFDGEDDFVEVPDDNTLDITDQISISAWVKIDQYVQWSSIVSKSQSGVDYNNYSLHISTYNGLSFTCKDSIIAMSNFIIPLNEWHHVILNWDGEFVELFLDGVLDTLAITSFTGQLPVNNSPLNIGVDFPHGVEYFSGKLDDIRIYNRPLNDDEIYFLFHIGCTYNVGVRKIIDPIGVLNLGTTIYPKAIIANYGNIIDTIPVSFEIGMVYADTNEIILSPLTFDTISFSNWVANTSGTFSTKCKTLLENDEDDKSDSLLNNVTISSGIGPDIYSITPNYGGNTGSVTVEIAGLGFIPGAIVKLKRAGQQDIIADTAIVDTLNYNKITTTFLFNNTAIGLWNLVIINPNSDSTIFYNGFTVEPVVEDLWVNISGPPQILSGNSTLYVISYGNNGNVDESKAEIVIWFNKIFTAKLYTQHEDSALIISPSMIDPNFYYNEVGLTAICPLTPPGGTGLLYLKLSAVSTPHSFYTIKYRIANNLYFLADTTNNKFKNVQINSLSSYKENSTKTTSFEICSQIWGKINMEEYIYHPVVFIKEIDQNNNIISEFGYTEVADFNPKIQNCNKQWIKSASPLQLMNDFIAEGYYEITDKKCYPIGQFGLNTPNLLIQEYINHDYNNSNSCHIDQPTKDDVNNSYNCFGIQEHIFETVGINNGQGLFSQTDESKNVRPMLLWIQKFGLNWYNQGYKFDFYMQYHLDQIGSALSNKSGEIDGLMTLEIITSWDPNDKSGPSGFDTINYIKQNLPMYYLIRFENVDSATASAQNIVITDTLDANLNWSTVTFDNTSHNVSTITFDTITGVIKWEFNNINLPPNVNPPEGEGWIVFHANQKTVLPTGTQIKNKASIVFDYNPPIITNEWINTIDRGAPSSNVTHATYVDSTSYRIYWSGQDDNLGSGIREYAIYYTDHPDSTYVLWKRTPDTSAVFTGIKDSTYYFYSVATDNVGHTETYPATYDFSLTIIDYSGIHENTSGNSIMIFPNPAKSEITVMWRNSIKKEYNLALYDMYGKRLIYFSGIKSEREIIDISNLKPGVYFVQLASNKSYSSKFIKIE